MDLNILKLFKILDQLFFIFSVIFFFRQSKLKGIKGVSPIESFYL